MYIDGRAVGFGEGTTTFVGALVGELEGNIWVTDVMYGYNISPARDELTIFNITLLPVD